MPQDLWDTVRKTAPLSPVHYVFRLHGWKGAPWHVLRVELIEALNQPYRLTLELVVDDDRLDLEDLLGDACTFELDRGGDARTVHGLVLAADDLGHAAGRHHVRVEVGPALALLAQTVDTRAWQDLGAPDILRLVLGEPLAAHGRSVSLDALAAGDYPRREYCVQYRESDLAFAARLMEEEGITYYFDHSGPAERLVLVDDGRDFPGLQEAALEIVTTEPDTAHAESVQQFTWGRRLCSTAVAQRNFDWVAPDAPLAAARPGADRRGRTREVYEHDDIVYPGDGARHAKIKQERHAVRGKLAHGTSNAVGVAPGAWFALQGHARSSLDDKYLVTRAVHRGFAPNVAILVQQQAADGPRYTNEFECIPLAEPHRPPLLHSKPRVSGLQTAIVTGPPGEDVHCDEHGRIKVLPHWDRHAPSDDTSSWWVRVAQAFAGPGWGSFFLPRIGMEVVLDFLDGDPDRPLVVGCVYNGANAPPYPLPAEKTKTTIKSNSTPGGGGSNELRFEDQAGSEEVYLHAQKDLNAVVNNNMSDSVGANRTTSVGANDTTSVGANSTTSVGANATLSVAANLTESVGAMHTMTVAATQSISAGATQSVSAGASQSLSAGTSQSLSAGTSQSLSAGTKMTVSAGTSQSVTVGADQSIAVTGSRTVSVTGSETQTVLAGRTTNVTGPHAETILGPDTLTVIGPRTETIVGACTINVVGPHATTAAAAAGLTAPQYTITADPVTLIAGGTTVVISGGGVAITSGGPVAIQGSGPVDIVGQPVNVQGSTVTVAGGTVAIQGGMITIN